MAPQISIVMPVYNAGCYLSESIDSILNQSFRDFEFIILDDNSGDGSLEIIKSYASADARISFHPTDENKGLVFQLNRGISCAKGKYVARMDADDIAVIDRLKIQWEFLEQNSNIDLCSSFFSKFGDQNSQIKLPVTDSEIKTFLLVNSPICHASVLARREIFEKFSYEQGFPAAEDYRLWTQMAFTCKFYNIATVLYYYRIYGSNSSFDQDIVAKKAMALKVIRRDYLRKIVRNFNNDKFELFNSVITMNKELIVNKKLVDDFMNYTSEISTTGFLEKTHVAEFGFQYLKRLLLSTKRYQFFVGPRILISYPQIIMRLSLKDLCRIMVRSFS